MATAIGHNQEFDSGVESISFYLEQLQQYLDTNKIKDEQEVSVLLTVIGPKLGLWHALQSTSSR